MAETATLNGSPISRCPLVLVPGDRSLPAADQDFSLNIGSSSLPACRLWDRLGLVATITLSTCGIQRLPDPGWTLMSPGSCLVTFNWQGQFLVHKLFFFLSEAGTGTQCPLPTELAISLAQTRILNAS